MSDYAGHVESVYLCPYRTTELCKNRDDYMPGAQISYTAGHDCGVRGTLVTEDGMPVCRIGFKLIGILSTLKIVGDEDIEKEEQS